MMHEAGVLRGDVFISKDEPRKAAYAAVDTWLKATRLLAP